MLTMKPGDTRDLAMPLPEGAKLVGDRKPSWLTYPPDTLSLVTNADGDVATVTVGAGQEGRSALVECVALLKGKGRDAEPSELRAYETVNIGGATRLTTLHQEPAKEVKG
jgi:hypothetical protein